MTHGNRIATDVLVEFLERLLVAGGFTPIEGAAIAKSLTLSERLGYGSHGISQALRYVADRRDGKLVSGVQFKALRDTANSLTADAQAGVGQIVMRALLQAAYSKLSNQSSVTIAVRNCGPIGRLGEWVEEPAKMGYAALLLANDNGSDLFVAPPRGKRAVTSTNPVAFGIPLPENQIFSADMSTSTISFGTVSRARRLGTMLPPSCIQDCNGHPTMDPEALFTNPPGAILPMGGAQGYKGFALSMFVDLLVAGLSGGQAPPAQGSFKGENCIVLMIWNPKYYAGLEHMAAQAAKYIEFVRQSPPTDAAEPICIPGDRTNAARQDATPGKIDVPQQVVDDFAKLADELGITIPEFEFFL